MLSIVVKGETSRRTRTLFLLLLLPLIFGVSCSHKELKNEVFVIEKRWATSALKEEHLGARYLHHMTPMPYKDLIIQGNAVDGIAAFDRSSGQVRWRLPIKNGVEPSATLVDGVLYFGSSDGYFYSISADNGSIHWTFPIRAEGLGQPKVKSGVVYFLAGNNVAYALEAATGKQLWLYNRRDTSTLSVRGGSAPAFYGSTVYFGFSDGSLVAINRLNGEMIWEKNLNRNRRFRDVDATPVLEGQRLYVSSFDGRLYCLNSQNGEVIWSLSRGGYWPVTLGSNNLLYFSTSGGEVLAVDKNKGNIAWSYKVGHRGIASQPILYKENLLAFGESEGGLRVLNAYRGTEVGVYYPGRGVSSTPLVEDKTGDVYFISVNANLFALRMEWQTPSQSWPWKQK